MISLKKDKKYLLACSYGPDSMALFDMLKKGNFRFSVAHVNYNLRPESSQETEDLKRYCNQNNIEIFIKENGKKLNSNIEERCREIRYSFFKEIYNMYGFDYLLIAHNEDDNIETYLLQQKRKNLVLFYGISCKSSLFSMEVLRPLLGFKKSELLSYCKANNVPFAIDSTNLENTFLRNKIRHEIVELLSDKEREEIINEINTKNLQLDEVIKTVDDFKSDDVSILNQVEDKTYPYLINKLARQKMSNVEISCRLCNEIKKSLNSDKPNVVVKIKKDFCFLKEYDKFRFDFVKPISYTFKVNLGDVIDNEFFYFDTSFDLKKRNLTEQDFPLIISSPSKNDEVQIKNYSVKLRRLFIDWKMPVSLRNRWPVIRNKNNEIVYVPRYQKDFKKSSAQNFFVKI